MSSNATDPGPRRATEGRGLAALVLVQVVTVVDFTILLPLGPDLVEPLGLAAERLPLLIAAGTVSAALAGLAGGRWLERVHRRRTMVRLLLALAAASALAASAGDWKTLLLARLGAGAAGGQAMALSLVVLSDIVPEARRGRGVGILMAANGLSAIAGVPLGLWSAGQLGWQAPFLMTFIGALAAAYVASRALPRTSDAALGAGSVSSLLADPTARRALLLIFVVTAASFSLTPSLSAFLQNNLDYPRDQLPGLYALAGASALVVTQLSGRAVDRWGAFRVGSAAVGVFIAVVLVMVVVDAGLPVALGFVLLLCSLQSRNVSTRALATRVPPPDARGRFMSLLSSSQQLGATAGAVLSTAMLGTAPDGRLIGMPSVGLAAIALALVSLPTLAAVHRGVTRARPSP